MAIRRISLFGLFLLTIAMIIGTYQLSTILYSSHKSEDAFKTVMGWGFRETTPLRSGFETQKKMEGIIFAADPKTVISYFPKPRPGEISIEEFKMIADNGAPDKVILDARDVDEAMSGMLKGAINIPISRIKKRLAELPKYKEIITHCNTGFRAKIAYDRLKENGFKARFLNAVIQVEKDGKYKITKK